MSIEADDWPEALRGILDIHEELYQRGEWATLTGWLERHNRLGQIRAAGHNARAATDRIHCAIDSCEHD